MKETELAFETSSLTKNRGDAILKTCVSLGIFVTTK